MPVMKIVDLKTNVDGTNNQLFDPQLGIYLVKRQLKYKIENCFGKGSMSVGVISAEYITADVYYQLDVEGTVVDVNVSLVCYPRDLFLKSISANANGKHIELKPMTKNVNMARTRELCDRIVVNAYLFNKTSDDLLSESSGVKSAIKLKPLN
jgi:hypothetical protein